MAFVVDNSVVCGWIIGNQATDYPGAVALRMLDEQAHAPALWQLEFSNVLRTVCKRGALDALGAHEVIEQIAALPIMVDRDTPGPAAILTLALRYDLTSYDAAYLELALRLQLPIATDAGYGVDGGGQGSRGWAIQSGRPIGFYTYYLGPIIPRRGLRGGSLRA